MSHSSKLDHIESKQNAKDAKSISDVQTVSDIIVKQPTDKSESRLRRVIDRIGHARAIKKARIRQRKAFERVMADVVDITRHTNTSEPVMAHSHEISIGIANDARYGGLYSMYLEESGLNHEKLGEALTFMSRNSGTLEAVDILFFVSVPNETCTVEETFNGGLFDAWITIARTPEERDSIVTQYKELYESDPDKCMWTNAFTCTQPDFILEDYRRC